MKQKSRLQLKRNLALLLVLSMLFGLSTAAYAAEEVGVPEASEAVSDEAYQAEAMLPDTEITEDVIADGAMNTGSGNKTSLSGGSISISLNTAGMHPSADSGKSLPNPEIISYQDREDSVSQFSDGRKYLGDTAGIEYSVFEKDGSVLIKDKDYTEAYFFTSADYDTEETVAVPVEKTKVLDREGYVTVSINGIGDYAESISLSYIVEKKLITISEDSVSLNWINDSLTVENRIEETLYVYAVSQNDMTAKDRDDNIGEYIEIRPKESTVLRQAYVKNSVSGNEDYEWVEEPFKEGVTYELAVYPDKLFSPNEGKSQLFVFTPGGNSYVTNIDLGQFINFKATINKSTQKISLSWKPGKDKAYKSYKLKRLNADNETFDLIDGWGDKQLTKKSFTLKAVEKGDSPAVFLLECYKNGSTVPDGQYIAVASPVLYYVTTGQEPKDAEYCFSKLYGGDKLSYNVEMSLNRKFDHQDGSRDNFLIRSEECFDSGFYPIKKTLSADTVMTTFYSHYDDEEDNKSGTVFYQRVTAVYEYKGKTFDSEPSNIVSRKAGPRKADVFNINGVQDLSIMNDYLTEMLANSEADEEGSGFPECSSISQGFVHKYDEGPDAKHGYVVFVAPKENDLKGYELFMADSANGSYKKLKFYKLDASGNPAKNSGLYKWEGQPTSGDAYKWLWEDNLQVYYAKYNKFFPGETKYYAVRAIDKKNNAGGLSDGYECSAELDDVWDACAFRTNKDKNISLYWTHDDSAAFYRIYRTETNKDDDKFDMDLDKTLIATVKNKKAGTLDRSKPKNSEKELVAYLNAPLSVSGGEIRDSEFEGPYNKYVDKKGLAAGKDYDYVIEPVLKKDGDLEDTIDKAGFATTYNYGEELDTVKTAAYMSLFGKSTKAKKTKTRLNVYIKSSSVQNSKTGLAELKWQPSDKKLASGLKYRIEYCIITGKTPKKLTWYNIQGNGAGNWTWRTDWTDNGTLKRGAIKRYRITPMYPVADNKVLLGKTKVIGQVSFADKIELKVGKSTIKKGGSTTIKVYPKRTQNPRGVSYKDIVVTCSNEELLKVTKQYVSKGGYWLIKVNAKGNKTGSGLIKFASKSYSHATGIIPYQSVNMKVVK